MPKISSQFVESIIYVCFDAELFDISVFFSDFFLFVCGNLQASASPVLESIIERPQKQRSTERRISISGVPYDAVHVFLQFLYFSK